MKVQDEKSNPRYQGFTSLINRLSWMKCLEVTLPAQVAWFGYGWYCIVRMDCHASSYGSMGHLVSQYRAAKGYDLDLKEQQRVQYQHDLSNHLDILSLPRMDRLKHYGLHFAKYAGRVARGSAERKSLDETLVDAFLVSLSAANVLNQALPVTGEISIEGASDLDFISYCGQFADACEKIDHLEEFREIALNSNLSIMGWILCASQKCNIELLELASQRRRQLASRLVFSVGS